MDLNYNLYLERANNEIKFADISLFVSNNKNIQIDVMKIEEPETYYSSVISHAYYCIFYSAKAFLYTKSIITTPPEEHKKTLEEFEKLAASGQIDEELVRIYKDIVVKTEELLGIFAKEKSKRGKFTYRMLPQANLEPAKESLKNAEKFYKNINLMIKGKSTPSYSQTL